MLKIITGAALAAVIAGLGAGAWLALKPRGDAFADCRQGAVAGGAASIGGPFTLTDQTGKRVTDTQVIDRPAILYFGYTFCPDICPMDNARNAEAVDILKTRGIDVKPVFITVDPERDTPEVLAEFVGWLHDDMVGLTGSVAEIEAVKRDFRVFAAKEGDGEDYLMSHQTYSYLLAPGHGFLGFFTNSISAEEMADRVQCFAERL